MASMLLTYRSKCAIPCNLCNRPNFTFTEAVHPLNTGVRSVAVIPLLLNQLQIFFHYLGDGYTQWYCCWDYKVWLATQFTWNGTNSLLHFT